MDDFEKEYPDFDWKNTPAYKHPGGKNCPCPKHEYIREQVTRVLLERLIVHRPHPWGLLITFIELIKNPRYSFWSHGFTHCATEIERVFESVARCIPRRAATHILQK